MRPLADHVARAGFAAGTPVVVARLTDSGIYAFAAGAPFETVDRLLAALLNDD